MANINFTMTPGNYVYGQDEHGKYAYGVVRCGSTSSRSRSAQRAAGGKDRQINDQGGHLIAHCLGGRNDETNLDAQNANVNQRGQRHVEQQILDLANNPNNTVFMSVENYCSNGSERPDATMITVAVRDNTTGYVDVQEFNFQNASYEEQSEWNSITNEIPEIDPRQDVGMTPEQRELANEYAEYDVLDDGLGQGRAFFFDENSTPVVSEQNTITEANQNNNEVARNTVAEISPDDDGLNQGRIAMTDHTAMVEDGLNIEEDHLSVDTTMDDGLDNGSDGINSSSCGMDDDGLNFDSSVSAIMGDGMDNSSDGMDSGMDNG